MALKNIKTPLILKQTERLGFRDPAAYYHEGTMYLYFTMVHQEEREQYFTIGMCKSTDLIHWSEPVSLTLKDKAKEYSSPGNLFYHDGSWYLCMQTYCRENGERFGNENSRIYTMRTTDLEHFEEPVLLRVKGKDVPEEEMGRMIDPFLVRDKDAPEIIWCFYKQNGVSWSWSRDLVNWTWAGSAPCGENVCVIVKDGLYWIFHSPENGIGLLKSADLKHFEPGAPDNYLSQSRFLWARDRITAGFVLDGTQIPGIDGYLMFYHGDDERGGDFPFGASIAMAYTPDLEHYVTFEPEEPTYPGLGRIYPGDYYEELPFEEYIDKKQKLPEGERVFDIRRFGASPIPERVNTAAIQAAADACRKAGGGTVLVAGGNYLSGTIHLYDNTVLHIAPDAVLTASRESGRLDTAFIMAENAENVVITGGGAIHGNGEWYVYEPKLKPRLTPMEVTRLAERGTRDDSLPSDTLRYNYRRRIRFSVDKYREGVGETRRPGFLVYLKECKNVSVKNVVLRDSMAWTLNLYACDRVLVEDMVIDNNRHVANTDGIDVTGSSHVEIRHCFISTADDGIVLKNPQDTGRSMEDIRIRDCSVITVMNAFKIGTETAWDISRVSVEDCRFFMPDLYPGTTSGIAVESADGSRIRDVSLKNISMDRVTCPLFLCLNCRNRYGFPAETEDDRGWGGAIEDIRIAHVTAENAEVPSLIFGFACETEDGAAIRRPVKNITVEDFCVRYRNTRAVLHVPEKIEEYLKEYPENNTFGDVDACGIWVRHADGIRLEGIDITPRAEETRKKIRLYDVRG